MIRDEFEKVTGFQAKKKHCRILKIILFASQATERVYACLLLVLTNYKPNTHNLVQLNSLAILQNGQIATVFPQDTKQQRRRFQLLKNAYIDVRYSEHFEITKEELNWLAERVSLLQQLTETLCQEKIKNYQ